MALRPQRNTPRPVWLALIFALVFQCAVFSGTRLFTAGWRHTDMTVPADRFFPFLPWTASVYVAAYIFWALNYILSVRGGGERAWRFLAADALGKTVCLGFFLLLPTAHGRPAVPADAPLGWMLRVIYALDTPDNLFPSIHCLNSWLCWAGVRGREDIPRGYRVFSLVMALAVAVSTLTTRQHVLADAIAGLVLGELCWQIGGCTGLGRWYGRLWRM